MKIKIKKKQPNSKMSFVCGLRNSIGLHSSFYELNNGELVAVFSPKKGHQGYPGRLHGGLAITILDETIGRAIMMESAKKYVGVTIEFSSRFRKPIPLDTEVRVVARITRESSRVFEGTGEVILEDGTIAIEGKGKYMKFEISKIADFKKHEQEWEIVNSPDDPDYFDI